MKEFNQEQQVSSKPSLDDVASKNERLSATSLPSFEHMMELAREQPDELERIRQQVTRDVIASAPAHLRSRLEGLQFQIDMERKRSVNHVNTCLKISSMMHDSLDELREVLTNPEEYLRNRQRDTAEVLEFKAKN